MDFSYNLINKGNISIIALNGELIDKNQASELLAEVEKSIAANQNKFVLNLEGLNYMNSSGLNIMINILTKARKNGGEVALYGANDKVNKLLVITKLNSVFNVCENVDKAVELLNK